MTARIGIWFPSKEGALEYAVYMIQCELNTEQVQPF